MDADVDTDVAVEIPGRNTEIEQALRHGFSGVVRNQKKWAGAMQPLFADGPRILRPQKLLRTVQDMTPGLMSSDSE